MKCWNVGLIGAGNIGAEHAKGFREFSGRARLAAVSDVNPDAAKALAEEFEVGETFADASQLIASDGIDAVVVAVPNRWHAPLALEAMEAGRHVLLEKPMGIDLEAAREIHAAREKSGVVLLLAHQMRWMGWAGAMRRVVDSGKLGRILHTRVSWMRRKGIPGWGTWFTRKELSGGGPLIDIAVHLLDLAFWYMGDVRPIAVSGTIAAAFGPGRKGIGDWGTPDWDGLFDVEDLANAFVRLDDGASIALDVSWAAHHGRNAWTVDLIGEKGGLNCTEGEVRFFTEAEGETIDEEIAWEEADERADFTAHFLDCLDGVAQPETDAASGLRNNAVLEAIYRSAAEGREAAVEVNA